MLAIRTPRLLLFLCVLGLLTTPIGVPATGVSAPPPVSLALIGDAPYDDPQPAQFPGLVADINADDGVRFVLHNGDVKTGGTPCSDDFMTTRFALFDAFDDPFVFTPGDNDWTDCHRATAGGYDPFERLAFLRELAYPVPGRTRGGHPLRVESQALVNPLRSAYVENQMWVTSNVQLATLHVVGSNDGWSPWTDKIDDPVARISELQDRRAADLEWLDRAFDAAARDNRAAVVVMMQADPFLPTEATAVPSDEEPAVVTPPVVGLPFVTLIDRFTARAREFGRPVLLVHGDEHKYRLDRPFPTAPNVTRLEPYGSTVECWVRLTLRPDTSEVFEIESRHVAANTTATPPCAP